MTGKWVVRASALLILLGYVLPSVTVSCSGLPGFGETFSISDLSGDQPLLYLIPISGLAILVLAFLNAQNHAQTTGFFWGQAAGVGISMISILITMASLSDQAGQMGMQVSSEAGIFVLAAGYLGVGIGLVMQWTELNRGSPSIMQPIRDPAHLKQSSSQQELSNPIPESPAVQGVRLELVSGNYPVKEVSIFSTDFSIGRGSQNDLVLPDPEVSRQHARLRCAQGAWFVQDQGSKARTLVNGHQVQAARLYSGDQIKLGEFTFLFREG